MLLFIKLGWNKRERVTNISKHLMLLFIMCYISFLHQLQGYFKTSHVIVYRAIQRGFDNQAVNFKTSHVIVYLRILKKPLPSSTHFKTSHVIVYPSHFRVFSFSPPLFPLIFSIFLHFLPANTLILDRPTYHPINLLIFQAFLDFSFFFRLVKIL